MPAVNLSRRVVSEARKQARARAEANDKPLIDELNAEARKLGYRGWNRVINVYRSQHAT